MPASTSLLAYQDCADLYDRALNDQRGIRVRQPSNTHAYQLRLRLHCYRTLVRKENASIYEPGHALHGRSIYDDVIVTIDWVDLNSTSGDAWVILQKISARVFEVESLSGSTTEPKVIEHEEPKQLEAPKEFTFRRV